jgi:hypothetical protein
VSSAGRVVFASGNDAGTAELWSASEADGGAGGGGAAAAPDVRCLDAAHAHDGNKNHMLPATSSIRILNPRFSS